MTQQEGDLNVFRGKVTNVFTRLRCVGIRVQQGTLRRGDNIRFLKARSLEIDHEGDYEHTQIIDSIQIDHQSVEEVTAGEICGVKINIPSPGLLPPNGTEVTRILTG